MLNKQMIKLLNFMAELVGSDYEYSKTELAARGGNSPPDTLNAEVRTHPALQVNSTHQFYANISHSRSNLGSTAPGQRGVLSVAEARVTTAAK